MNRPLALRDLPAPPAGRTGWPWTEAGPPLPSRRQDGSDWPRITIVTPSYNQAQFLEETIRSIHLQGYPNLEHLIMDGGSTDGSVEILRKYAPFIDYWVSEKDGGQSQAINRGFARATGDILGWLNSDDVFEPGALGCVAEGLSGQSGWLAGTCRETDAYGAPGRTYPPVLFPAVADWVERFLDGSSCSIPQPSAFWTKEAWKRAGPLREEMCFVFDHDFFLRLYCLFGPPVILEPVLSLSRVHAAAKSHGSSMHFAAEYVDTGLRQKHLLPPGRRWRVPFRVARTRGRQALYQSIDLARRGEKGRSGIRLLKALALWPFLVYDRMFLGFLRQSIFGRIEPSASIRSSAS